MVYLYGITYVLGHDHAVKWVRLNSACVSGIERICRLTVAYLNVLT